MSPQVEQRQKPFASSACLLQVATGGLAEPQVPCMCVGRWLIFPLTDCHPCCRPSSATAAFLVSLYIKDIWLGAQRPESLLTHVRMVLDATEDRQAGDEEPIVRLCRDLTAVPPTLDPLPACASGSRL